MWLTVEEPNRAARRVEIAGSTFSIGRHGRCDLVLSDPQVSARHAVLEARPDGTLAVRDLSSTNGTEVNGHKISGPVELHSGERVAVGRTILTIAADPAEAAGNGAPLLGAGDGAQRAGAAAERPHADGRAAPAAPPREPAGGRRESAVVRLSKGVRRSQSTVIRQLTRTTHRALAVAVVAVLVAVGAAGAAAFGIFSSSKPTPSQIARAVAPSTVLVIGSADGQPIEKGSGWVLDANQGLVVTNDHVAEGAASLTVTAGTAAGADASADRRSASIVGANPCEDVAVLRVNDASGLRTMRLGSQSSLHAGDGVVALGFPATAAGASNPLVSPLIVTSGTVSTPNTQYPSAASQGQEANLPDVIQTDTVINHGNSGGPLVDYNKRLVGMNTVTFMGSPQEQVSGQNYAIGVDHLKGVISQLEGGSADTAGFVLDPGADTQDSQQINNFPSGIVVDGAVDGSPAAQLQLPFNPSLPPPFTNSNPPPSILTAINGQRLGDDKSAYCSMVQSLSPGQSAQVTIARPTAVSGGNIQYSQSNYQVNFQ